MIVNKFWNDLLTKGAILGGIMLISHCIEQCIFVYGGTIGWLTVMGIEWIVAVVLYTYLVYRFTKSYAASVMEQQGEVKVFTYGNGLSYILSVSILAGTIVGVGAYILRHNIIGHTEYVTKVAEMMINILKSTPEAAQIGDMSQMVNQILQQPEPSIFSTIASNIWNYMLGGLLVGLFVAGFTKHSPKLFDKNQEENNAE